MQRRVPNTSAGSWFQSWMVLFTKEYFPISVLCLLLIFRSWHRDIQCTISAHGTGDRSWVPWKMAQGRLFLWSKSHHCRACSVQTHDTWQSRTEQIRSDQNRTEQNRTEQNRTEQNGSDRIRSDQNRTEQNRTDQTRTEQNRTDQIGSDQIRSDQIRSEQPRCVCTTHLVAPASHLRTFRVTTWAESDRIRRWKTAAERAVFGLLPVYEWISLFVLPAVHVGSHCALGSSP